MTLDDRIIAHSKGFHVDELDDRSLRNIMDSVINQYHRQETALRELIQNALGAFATDSHMFFEKVNDGGVYRIRYVDNGIGMSKDDALNLFLCEIPVGVLGVIAATRLKNKLLLPGENFCPGLGNKQQWIRDHQPQGHHCYEEERRP